MHFSANGPLMADQSVLSVTENRQGSFTATRCFPQINSSSKAKAVREGDDCFPSFRDQVISAAIPDLCRTMFRQESISGLPPAQKAEALRQIRRRFSADPAQIARVTGVPYQEVISLMEEYF